MKERVICNFGFPDKLGALDTGILKYYRTDQMTKHVRIRIMLRVHVFICIPFF